MPPPPSLLSSPSAFDKHGKAIPAKDPKLRMPEGSKEEFVPFGQADELTHASAALLPACQGRPQLRLVAARRPTCPRVCFSARGSQARRWATGARSISNVSLNSTAPIAQPIDTCPAHMSIGAAPPPGAWPGIYRVSLALCADPLLVPTGALQARFVYGCAAA